MNKLIFGFFCLGIVTIISLGCGILINKMTGDGDPIVVFGLPNEHKPIYEIPFPAITICPITKVKQRIFNYTEAIDAYIKLKNLNLENENKNLTSSFNTDIEGGFEVMKLISQVCDLKMKVFGDEPKYVESYNELLEILTTVAPSSSEVFQGCQYHGQILTCLLFLQEVLTSEGLCFTFNGLTATEIYRVENLDQDFHLHTTNFYSKHWDRQNGYYEDKFLLYPSRIWASKSEAGLQLTLQSNILDQDYECQGPIEGFKVTIHSPDDIPQVSRSHILVPSDVMFEIKVSPQVITTSDDLQAIAPYKRQCYFNGEKSLKFFQNYTQSNCDLECITNKTLEICGCVKFSMPRNETTPICGHTWELQSCIWLVESKFYINHETTNKENHMKIIKQTDCDCLPQCTSIQYDYSVSSIPYATGANYPDYPNLLSDIKVLIEQPVVPVLERRLFKKTELDNNIWIILSVTVAVVIIIGGILLCKSVIKLADNLGGV